MPAIGLTTPVRKAGLQNFQLNAGIFLINFNYSTAANSEDLRTAIKAAVVAGTNILGITRGGGSFVVTSEMRTPEFDGQRYRFVNGEFVDSVDAYLSGTLLEVTPENFKHLVATGDSSTTGKITTVTVHTQVVEDDYIDSLVWVGDLADGRYVLIDLKNALNTSGLNMTFTDKGEGTIPFEFHAHQDEVDDYDNAPFTIKFIDNPN